MLFLREFWMGSLAPGETRYRPDKDYTNAVKTMEQSEAHLKSILSEEDWMTFQQFADAAQKVSSFSECDNFVEGFRMGAKMMMDVLLDP